VRILAATYHTRVDAVHNSLQFGEVTAISTVPYGCRSAIHQGTYGSTFNRRWVIIAETPNSAVIRRHLHRRRRSDGVLGATGLQFAEKWRTL
jgi:hypothetical protein